MACLGAGYFSQFHYDSWARLDRVALVGSSDLDIALARATGLPAFDTLDDMLAEAQPDILDIILPPRAHADALRTAIAAQVPCLVHISPDDYANSVRETDDLFEKQAAFREKIGISHMSCPPHAWKNEHILASFVSHSVRDQIDVLMDRA